jgi:hypothetical protein
MSGFIGFTYINNDPYVYMQSNANQSTAAGMETSLGFGRYVVIASPTVGASPETANPQFMIDLGNIIGGVPVIQLDPGLGNFTILKQQISFDFYNNQQLNALIFTGSSNAVGQPIQVLPNGLTGEVLTAQAGGLPVWATPGSISNNVTGVDFAESPYTVLSTDYFLAVNATGGPVTVNLPPSPGTGKIFIIKDTAGIAATNHITISASGGVLIDGLASQVMNTNYESISVIFDGVNYEIF